MVAERSWQEFQESKLLWFINRSLHLFGWTICLEVDSFGNMAAYPARTSYRGFNLKDEEEGFIGLSKYLKDNCDILVEESKG